MSFKVLASFDENTDTAAVAPATTPSSTGSAAIDFGVSTDEAIISQGKVLFSDNCTQCHEVSNDDVIGPGLKDVHKRRPLEWILKFVKNSQKVIKSGDKYAVDLFNKHNKTEMPTHDFSDDEIKSVVSYIIYQSEHFVEVTAKEETGDGKVIGGSEKTGDSDKYFSVVLGVLLVVLLILVIVLYLIISILKNVLAQKKEQLTETEAYLVEQKFDLLAVLRSKVFIGIVAFIFICVVAYSGIMGLYGIGVTQGYEPQQPIAFSHKLHAGQYKIDCNYCHTCVRKSKNANIPSPNICMNCHSAIETESPEIKKIYAAIEDNKPIEWVRVHNLPDLVYFNHSQHVEVGGVECQTCHGPVEEMEVIKVHARLTMGWCINCHRRTAVNAEGNAYYDKLLEIHQQKGTKKPMVVADIGGINCVKCHY